MIVCVRGGIGHEYAAFPRKAGAHAVDHSAAGWWWFRVASSCDGGDFSVVEVDRLVEPAAEGDGESGEDVVSGDLAAFDL
jgi:hypothetical protein